jgi:hypothetical protein
MPRYLERLPSARGAREKMLLVGWTGRWEAYRSSYRGKHLFAPGLAPFFRVNAFLRAHAGRALAPARDPAHMERGPGAAGGELTEQGALT